MYFDLTQADRDGGYRTLNPYICKGSLEKQMEELMWIQYTVEQEHGLKGEYKQLVVRPSNNNINVGRYIVIRGNKRGCRESMFKTASEAVERYNSLVLPKTINYLKTFRSLYATKVLNRINIDSEGNHTVTIGNDTFIAKLVDEGILLLDAKPHADVCIKIESVKVRVRAEEVFLK